VNRRADRRLGLFALRRFRVVRPDLCPELCPRWPGLDAPVDRVLSKNRNEVVLGLEWRPRSRIGDQAHLES